MKRQHVVYKREPVKPSDYPIAVGYGYDRHTTLRKHERHEGLDRFLEVGLDAHQQFWHHRGRCDAWKMGPQGERRF